MNDHGSIEGRAEEGAPGPSADAFGFADEFGALRNRFAGILSDDSDQQADSGKFRPEQLNVRGLR